MANPNIRIGNPERDAALERLNTHFANGYLDQTEFQSRSQRLAEARTQDELSSLFDDLPSSTQTTTAPTTPTPAAAAPARPAAQHSTPTPAVAPAAGAGTGSATNRKRTLDMAALGFVLLCTALFFLLHFVFDVSNAWLIFPFMGLIIGAAYMFYGTGDRAG